MPILRIAGTSIAIETREGEAILPALIRTGYSYKFGCKRGGCGICKLDLAEGEVEYPVTVAESVISQEERETVALSCRAVPVTDTVIQMNPDNMFKSVAPFFAALLSQTRAAAEAQAKVAAATTAAVKAAAASVVEDSAEKKSAADPSRTTDPPSGD